MSVARRPHLGVGTRQRIAAAAAVVLAWAVIATGCTSRRTPPGPSALQQQPSIPHLARPVEPEPKQRVSALLDFESASAVQFVTGLPSSPHVAPGESAAGGRASLLLAPGPRRRLVVELPSLLAGSAFPGSWTLIGAQFRADRTITVTAQYEFDGHVVIARTARVAAGEWTPVMLDLAAAAELTTSMDVGVLAFEITAPAAAVVRCDDVVLVDNRHTLVDAAVAGGWTVERRGLRLMVERRGERPVSFSLDLSDGGGDAAGGGWRVEEATPLRVRFASDGPVKSLTAYVDGRALWDGQFRPIDRAATTERAQAAAAHATPGEIEVASGQGRVSRNTPGDADNDGYNERLGAYQVQASGPRVEVSLAPRGAPLPRPVLQVAGLPPGKVLVTMEGQLVETTTRLPDGQLLVILPATLARATSVNVRVQ